MTSILHVITGLSSNGAERMLSRLVLAKRGLEGTRQVVVSLMGEDVLSRVFAEAGADVRHLGMRRGIPSLGTVVRLSRIIQRERPDIIMTWLYHADLVGTIAAMLAGFPTRRIIWNLRAASMDFSHYGKSTRVVAAMLARLSWLPGAVTVNARRAVADHSAIGYRPRRWMHVPNGFDLNVWRPDLRDRATVRAELGIGEEELAVVLVARVAPQKDHATFLAASEQIADASRKVRFVLIGKGTDDLPIPSTLHERLLALGERQDIPRLLRGLDVAVLTSASGEGLPNAVCEAMATGLPAVVTDVGDSPELVEGTGAVVPPHAPGKIAQEVLRLLSEDTEAKTRRSRAARQSIGDRYSLEHVTALYRTLWTETIHASDC